MLVFLQHHCAIIRTALAKQKNIKRQYFYQLLFENLAVLSMDLTIAIVVISLGVVIKEPWAEGKTETITVTTRYEISLYTANIVHMM